MSDEQQQTTLEAIQAARQSILSGGVTGVSSAGKSVSYISLESLEKAEQQERTRAQAEAGPFCGTIQSLPYDSRW